MIRVALLALVLFLTIRAFSNFATATFLLLTLALFLFLKALGNFAGAAYDRYKASRCPWCGCATESWSDHKSYCTDPNCGWSTGR